MTESTRPVPKKNPHRQSSFTEPELPQTANPKLLAPGTANLADQSTVGRGIVYPKPPIQNCLHLGRRTWRISLLPSPR